MSAAPKLSIAEARIRAAQVLVDNNTSPANAAATARALVAAEADGLAGHGLTRLASYAAQAKCGKVDGHILPILTQPRPALLRVDVALGFAYPAIDLALASLIPLAQSKGLAAASLFRSHHCGAMGLHVEHLARHGLCALMFANTPAALAPWGGQAAIYGTNPIAFAAPVPGGDPIVIDLSLSKVARGNIVAAKQKGTKIPEGWALDVSGNPTTDPEAALAGTMVPMGDAKGTALALMVEILAACLTGAVLSKDATSFLDAKGGPPAVGQMILAFDPAAFSGGGYDGRIGQLVTALAADAGARLPGTRRYENRRRAEAEGLAWLV